ncbi:MAG TPA: AAA family ATPase [Solirubrobacteraceae bacterium]|nr:AAA family ATPase [Solirubrobacteraceae bacterium]
MAPPTLRHAKAVLPGRATECAKLDQLLADARLGQSSVLVVRGEAGIGKSALLGYAAERAEGWRVLRAAGVEWEMELPFAGLHQLCAELLDGREQLPQPQNNAIATAFGLSSGPQPDRFLIGLAVLTLLSDAAEEHPLVCLVDDVQWLDRSSAQVLTFVARRLAAESVVLVFAERESSRHEELPGLPALRVGRLPDSSARELLASVITAPVDERVRSRILAEARGNPLALLELPREVSAEGFAGGFGLPGDGSLPARIEASFRRRVDQLPSETQRLLLVAAADPTGDPALLVRASEEIAVPIHQLSPAEADGLLELGAHVRFRHPLLRSAIYRAAPSDERHSAHRALAVATDPKVDPDRRVWHRAHAIASPDETIALELEQSAGRARARGGLAAAAAFLERSAALTPDPSHRAHRTLEAAITKELAGASQEALSLLARASAGPLDTLDQARLKLVHGQIEVDLSRGAEALPLLLDAATQLEPLDASLSRDAHLMALRAASVAGRLGPGLMRVACAALEAPRAPGEPRGVDLLVDGLAVRFTDGYAAGAPTLKLAVSALREEGQRREVSVRWPWFARRVAGELFDDDAWHYLCTRSVQLERENGALAVLPLALNHLAHVRCVEGDLDGAGALLDEADGIAVATGAEPLLFGRLPLAGFRGIEAEAVAIFEATGPGGIGRAGEGVVLTFSEYARAVLYNGLGRYEAALTPAQSASDRDELLLSTWSLPELVEAATRCGQRDVAAAAVESLSARSRAAGTELAIGISARSRALLSDGEVADRLYREAIERLGRTRLKVELARAHLLYGEWLRRDRRRIDAREQLRRAQDMFAAMGAEAFAARAGRELLATGETARKRTIETRDELTAQELQIAQLARDRLSNAEIGARLFISPRTVEYHLHKVFAKLGIASREHLDRVGLG